LLLLFFLCELDLELEEVEISSELVLTGFCCLTTKTAIMTTRMASKMPNAKRKSFFCLLTGFLGRRLGPLRLAAVAIGATGRRRFGRLGRRGPPKRLAKKPGFFGPRRRGLRRFEFVR